MNWETVVGLEVHVELKTASKMFCACSTRFGGEPNTRCCPVCLGLPGALPVLNEKALALAVKTGLALGCEITRRGRFDRKNYFYPDLPKAYQISQLFFPVCRNGKLTVETENGEKEIGIREIHMEEDAGKLFHENGRTKIDYNRCGVPLMEIVTEPDFRSGEEAVDFLEKLKAVLTYLDVSDCKMQEGSMRADINLSVRPAGSGALGTRTEMKNLGSFRAVKKAVSFEAKRQQEALQAGERIAQATLRWDENLEQAVFMRTKERQNDYRYFPEPDLPEIVISEEMLKRLKAELPELREARSVRFARQYGLPPYDCQMLTRDRQTADLLEKTVALGAGPKEVANWILGEGLRLFKEQGETAEWNMPPEKLHAILSLLKSGAINRDAAKEVFEAVFQKGVVVEEYIEQNGLTQVKNQEAIEKAVLEVLAQNEKAVRQYQEGKEKTLGFLVGETMKKLNRGASPQTVRELLQKNLGKNVHFI